jgi:transcription elongation factor GreB
LFRGAFDHWTAPKLSAASGAVSPRAENSQPGKLFLNFGAWVRLENDAGDEFEYRIVGPDEFDVAKGMISMDPPVGRALLGKTEGDEVVVRRPAGNTVFTIIGISYRF